MRGRRARLRPATPAGGAGAGTGEIRVEAVSQRFGDRVVLDEVSAVLHEHRIGVIGANGSGKSTFARLLNGLLIPARGQVVVDGIDTRRDAAAVRRRVGFVFQDPDAQIVYPTVAEDVGFSLKVRGVPAPDIGPRVEAVLRRYGLHHLRDQPAHLLSGGEKQLLAICAVLVTEPARVVFDEPTTLLDLRNTRRIAEVIAQLPQDVVLVTHDLDLLAAFDRVLVFAESRLVADAEPVEAIAAYVELLA